jgi:hypothetical protein
MDKFAVIKYDREASNIKIICITENDELLYEESYKLKATHTMIKYNNIILYKKSIINNKGYMTDDSESFCYYNKYNDFKYHEVVYFYDNVALYEYRQTNKYLDKSFTLFESQIRYEIYKYIIIV